MVLMSGFAESGSTLADSTGPRPAPAGQALLAGQAAGGPAPARRLKSSRHA
jgi:hypothetical protein